ncbi:DUF2335 domain-containing protein [uncultured Acetobacterium sp.]|uniref:DUF2335 domain-containing protein n=1 Tax=uncultured Acetobacterium sp. TaxID=217139 RepID=UPI0025CCB6C7|nr:DUF2335 domain-containing protein [uncultured Acetobacterium sp.]
MAERKNKTAELINLDESDDVDCIEAEELEQKSKEELLSIVMQMTREERFSGPLPHPQILRGYEEVVPGAAERILSMAENQATHRQQLEKAVINSNVRDSRMGVVFAFVIGIVGVSGGIYAVLQGAEWAGTLISGVSLGSIVGSFIYGTRSEKAERIEKSNDVE